MDQKQAQDDDTQSKQHNNLNLLSLSDDVEPLPIRRTSSLARLAAAFDLEPVPLADMKAAPTTNNTAIKFPATAYGATASAGIATGVAAPADSKNDNAFYSGFASASGNDRLSLPGTSNFTLSNAFNLHATSTVAAAAAAANPATETQPPINNTISGPSENDIVCARGKYMYNHPGCVRFRETVSSFIPIYMAASSRLDKSVVINSIIETVQDFEPDAGPPGKFLKYDSKTKGWSEMTNEQIRDKVGHALREAVHEIERQRNVNEVRKTGRLSPRR